MNRTITLWTVGGAIALLALLAWAPTAAAAELIHPTGGEFLSGTVTIEWERDAPDSEIELQLVASGAELEPKLCENCPGNTFTLDTTEYSDNDEYVLKLEEKGEDVRGREEVTTSGTFTIDNTVPDTEAVLDGPVGDAGWYTGDVTVELIAEDATAGVAETLVSVDGAPATAYTDTFRVTGDGSHTLTFWSVDKAGNTEATEQVSFSIDATDPVSELTIGEPRTDAGRTVYVTSDTDLVLSATDATSGVDELAYRVNQGPFQAYDGPIHLEGEDGEYVLEWRAIDAAGNVEEVQEKRFSLDNTAPALDRDRPQPGGIYVDDTLVAETHPVLVEAGSLSAGDSSAEADTVPFAVAAGNLTVQATSEDAGSGVAEVRFLVDGELRSTDTQAPYAWTWETGQERLGEHALTIESEDTLGNLATTSLDVEVLPTGQEGLNATVEEGPSFPGFLPAPQSSVGTPTLLDLLLAGPEVSLVV